MKILGTVALTSLFILTIEASADEFSMRRVLSCVGPDAKIEVYIPEKANLAKQVVGALSLDLTEAGKGKTLELVHVQYSGDKKSVIIDQYRRKLPHTIVPVSGGTVDFDQRFATGAKCGPFDQE